MQTSFQKTPSPELRIPCSCGGEMRLVGIEADKNTDEDICTYACLQCDRIEVTPPPTMH